MKKTIASKYDIYQDGSSNRNRDSLEVISQLFDIEENNSSLKEYDTTSNNLKSEIDNGEEPYLSRDTIDGFES